MELELYRVSMRDNTGGRHFLVTYELASGQQVIGWVTSVDLATQFPLQEAGKWSDSAVKWGHTCVGLDPV